MPAAGQVFRQRRLAATLRHLAAEGLTYLRVVLLADSISDQQMLDALQLGVQGVALKGMSPKLIMDCIRRVAAGETWIENDAFGTIMERAVRHNLRMQELRRLLTRRELDVLGLVADGLSNKEITERLKISGGTIKIHLNHIYRKVGVKGRRQLARCAHGETV